MQHRIKWIDVLKGLAIIVIYIGCFGSEAGKTYDFISTHHAALFFCILGLVENFNKEENILRYAIKKVKTVLIPCYVLAYLVVMIVTIQYEYGWDFIEKMNAIIAKGFIRNTFAADSLWYLTCLFSIQLIFFVIKKIKYKWLIFVICLGLHCCNALWINSIEYPHWYFNIDSALYYMIFYAAGYLVFPYVVKLFELDTRKKKFIFVITGGFSLIYSIGIYFGVDIFSRLPSFVWVFTSILKTGIIIWLYFVCARLMQEVKFFADIGKNMLYLCGSEYILKVLISTVLSIFGISIATNSPIQIFMYIGILVFVGNKYLVPVEEYLIGKIVRKV